MIEKKKIISEKNIEASLRDRIKALGGITFKFWPMSVANLPDRIVLMPKGRIWFVEVKRPGKKPTRGQEYMHEKLRELGFSVWVVDSMDMLEFFIDAI